MSVPSLCMCVCIEIQCIAFSNLKFVVEWKLKMLVRMEGERLAQKAIDWVSPLRPKVRRQGSEKTVEWRHRISVRPALSMFLSLSLGWVKKCSRVIINDIERLILSESEEVSNFHLCLLFCNPYSSQALATREVAKLIKQTEQGIEASLSCGQYTSPSLRFEQQCLRYPDPPQSGLSWRTLQYHNPWVRERA